MINLIELLIAGLGTGYFLYYLWNRWSRLPGNPGKDLL